MKITGGMARNVSMDARWRESEFIFWRSVSDHANPKFWDSDEAVKVAKGVHGFLKFFFKEKCRYSVKKSQRLTVFRIKDTWR